MDIILISTPKSINSLTMEILLIDTVKIGFLGFGNFGSKG